MRRRSLVMSLLGAVIVVVTGLAFAILPSEDHETRIIRPSWAFDLADPEEVAGFVDHIFVGRVIAPGRSVTRGEGIPSTDFDVSVLDVVQGGPPARTTVRQIGGHTSDGTFVVEGQPLLEAGSTYLLAVSDADGGSLQLLGSPIAATMVNSPEERRRVLEAWRVASQNRRAPDTLTR